jgi:hypothetical protein
MLEQQEQASSSSSPPPPAAAAAAAAGQQHLHPTTTTSSSSSFGLVAAYLERQSDLVQQHFDEQAEPFRPLLDIVNKCIIARLVTSLEKNNIKRRWKWTS